MSKCIVHKLYQRCILRKKIFKTTPQPGMQVNTTYKVQPKKGDVPQRHKYPPFSGTPLTTQVCTRLHQTEPLYSRLDAGSPTKEGSHLSRRDIEVSNRERGHVVGLGLLQNQLCHCLPHSWRQFEPMT